ncbi:MAG: zf-TFIIB domain-containing protein [Roseovarius sp.]
MQCPVDGEQLMIAERAGVEIDYCPKCRGVWLDRGELDKIIDRSVADTPPPPPQGGYREGEPRRKKRGGFLEELFDF